MSEARDPLEAELSALRPHEVSPELRRRVAERLAEHAPAKRRRLWWFALAGGLAAACLAAVLFRWGAGRRDEPESVVRPQPAPSAPVEDAEPTLWAYERALARSPEEVEALLNKHATATAGPDPEVVPVSAFLRSDAALHALLGDD
jgi:hypothetical protein